MNTKEKKIKGKEMLVDGLIKVGGSSEFKQILALSMDIKRKPLRTFFKRLFQLCAFIVTPRLLLIYVIYKIMSNTAKLIVPILYGASKKGYAPVDDEKDKDALRIILKMLLKVER